VIATSSASDKLQIAKDLGASDVINYRTTPNWAEEVRRLTGGRGADLVCDVAGWGTLEQSLTATRQGGTVCIVGMLTNPKNVEVLMPLLVGAKTCELFISQDAICWPRTDSTATVKGILSYSKKMLERAVSLAEEHDIHPRIEKTYEWEDAPAAFDKLRGQDFVGKIVIKV
jgi:NADPH:quinone reductase-like Zn-dependent oxidoreductase